MYVYIVACRRLALARVAIAREVMKDGPRAYCFWRHYSSINLVAFPVLPSLVPTGFKVAVSFGFACLYVDASVRLVSCGMTFVSLFFVESSVRIAGLFVWTVLMLYRFVCCSAVVRKV